MTAGTQVEVNGQRRHLNALLLAAALPFAYVPRFYRAEYDDAGQFKSLAPTRADVAATVEPSVIADLETATLPLKPAQDGTISQGCAPLRRARMMPTTPCKLGLG